MIDAVAYVAVRKQDGRYWTGDRWSMEFCEAHLSALSFDALPSRAHVEPDEWRSVGVALQHGESEQGQVGEVWLQGYRGIGAFLRQGVSVGDAAPDEDAWQEKANDEAEKARLELALAEAKAELESARQESAANEAGMRMAREAVAEADELLASARAELEMVRRDEKVSLADLDLMSTSDLLALVEVVWRNWPGKWGE